MIKRTGIIAYLLLALALFAQSKVQKFEGCINLKRETVYDTTYLKIRVKDNQVRLEEFDRNKVLVSILLISLDSEKVVAMSPSQKLFCELKKNRVVDPVLEDTIVIKTKNIMVVDGYSCCQMRVKSISHDCEVTFWVTQSDISFFQSMSKILREFKTDDNLLTYFPINCEAFPIMVVERTLFRKEKQKVLVTAIQQVTLSKNLFTIPRDYRKFEN